MFRKNLVFVILLAALTVLPKYASGQTIEILAGNTLNGSVNGTLLGGATMGLTNDSDFGPLRVGLGLGTLYGMGVGVYDLSSTEGSDLLVSGMFNDGTNTSIIVLLDTFYGAAAGALVVTSVMLVANEPLLDGLQYGSSVGAWAGFGFGLFDAFLLSERTVVGQAYNQASPNSANGLLAVNFDEKKSVGFISPTLTQTFQLNAGSIQNKISPAVNLVNLKVSF
ncbi:hypothetical protein [Gracilimonas mengyeensis]|uniref:Outer membrane protein beta-barrel domain-containing protein n=1 Tax=Gracilimonas mengyeensis TaxID=1302730 RepID=A0A521B4J4_9BACT|nr:hypothetical protein [Gracilimonas mengyeensis]SMO41993.1 hypothetical protein SAMN06265219_1024 [Gracilimonas mengyeensis]